MDILLQRIIGTSYSLPCLTYSLDNKLVMSDSKNRLILVDFDKLTNYSDPTVIGLTHYTLVSTCMDIFQITSSSKQTPATTHQLAQLSLLPEFHTITNSIRDTILKNTNSIIKSITFLTGQEHLRLKESVMLVLDTSGRFTIIKEDNKHITKHPEFKFSLIDLRSSSAIRFIEETVIVWYKIVGKSMLEKNINNEHILKLKLAVLNRVNCIILINVVLNLNTMENSCKEIFRGSIENKFIIVDMMESNEEIVFVMFCHETKTLIFYTERNNQFVGLGNINIRQYIVYEPILFNSIHIIGYNKQNNKITILLRGDSGLSIIKGITINKNNNNMISIEEFEFIDVNVIGEVAYVGSFNTNEGLVVYYINDKLEIIQCFNNTNNELIMIKEGVDRLKTKINSTFDKWKIKKIEIDMSKQCVYSVVSSNKEFFVLMSSMTSNRKEDGRLFSKTYMENEVVIKRNLNNELGNKICMNCFKIYNGHNNECGYDIMKENCMDCKIGELYYI